MRESKADLKVDAMATWLVPSRPHEPATRATRPKSDRAGLADKYGPWPGSDWHESARSGKIGPVIATPVRPGPVLPDPRLSLRTSS